MKKKRYYIVVDMKRILLKEKEYMESGFSYVSIVFSILRKNIKNPINMEERGKVEKNSYLQKKKCYFNIFKKEKINIEIVY